MSIFDFDAEKNAQNRAKHGVGFDEFVTFDQLPSVIEDKRYNYSERRFRAFGRIEGLGYMIVYVERSGRFRLISFRRAHDKEMRRHE